MKDPFERWYSKTMGKSDMNQLYGYAGLRAAYEADRQIDPFDMVIPSPGIEMQLHIKLGDNWIIDDTNCTVFASGYTKGIDSARDGEIRFYRDGEWRVIE